MNRNSEQKLFSRKTELLCFAGFFVMVCRCFIFAALKHDV